MPGDWSDISDLWWLKSAGQDVHQGNFGRGMALGAQIAESRSAMDMRRQQMQWQQEQGKILMEQRQAKMQDQEARTRGLAAISSYMSGVAARNDWTNPNALAGLHTLFSQYPQVMDDPTSAALIKPFEAARAAEAQAKQHLQTPTIIELKAATDYQKKAEVLQGIATKIGAGNPGFDEISAEARDWLEQSAMIKNKYADKGDSTKIYDPAGNLIVDITKGMAGKAAVPPGELTTGTRTQFQEALNSYGDAFATLSYLNKNLTASDFGVRGKFKEYYARIAGQLGVKVEPGTLTSRAALTTLNATMFRLLKSDQSMAEPERKLIEKGLPSTEDITESPQTALDKLNNVRRELTNRSISRSRALKVDRPSWLMTPEELYDKYLGLSGGQKMTPENKRLMNEDLKLYHGFEE